MRLSSVRTRGPMTSACYALLEDVEKATAFGFDAHLAKPPSIEALRRIPGRGRR